MKKQIQNYTEYDHMMDHYAKIYGLYQINEFAATSETLQGCKLWVERAKRLEIPFVIARHKTPKKWLVITDWEPTGFWLSAKGIEGAQVDDHYTRTVRVSNGEQVYNDLEQAVCDVRDILQHPDQLVVYHGSHQAQTKEQWLESLQKFYESEEARIFP